MNPASQNLSLLIRKNSYYVLFGKLLTPIVTFWITGYIVRHISINDYGIYNTLIAVMGYIGLISSLGLLNIYQRYIPDFYYQKEFAHIKLLLRRGIVYRFILTSICILLIFLFATKTGKLFKMEGYFSYFKLFSIGILFAMESELLGLALTSLFLHKYYVISQIIYTWFRALILFLLLRRGGNLNHLLICEVIAYAVMFIIQSFWYYTQFEKKYPQSAKTEFPHKRVLRYGGFSYFNEMGEQILDVSTDYLVISYFLGAHMVGLYAFANQILRLLSRWMPHMMVMDVITPSFFTRYSQKRNVSELTMMFHLLIKFVAFFLFPMLVGLIVLGDKLIIYFFDSKFLSALNVFYIVAAFTTLNAFATPLGLLVQSVEKVEIHFISKIFSIYNLIGDILVVKPFGIIGVALVTSTAILFKNLYTYYSIRKTIHLHIPYKAFIRIAINSLLMGFAIYLFRFKIVNVYCFLMAVLGAILIYILVSAVNRSFQQEERQVINTIIGKRWFIF